MTETELNKKTKTELVRMYLNLEKNFLVHKNDMDTKVSTAKSNAYKTEKSAGEETKKLVGLIKQLYNFITSRPNFIKTCITNEEQTMFDKVKKICL